MEINRDNIREILTNYDIVPTKDNGQNFLVEPLIADRIVSLMDIEPNDNILEIGPGVGSLTHFISNKSKIDVVEIDEKIAFMLSRTYSPQQVSIFNTNIFNFNIGKFDKIISNVPYSITSKLLEYLLSKAKNAKQLILMCQEEVVDKLVATKGGLYGPLSVYISLLGTIKKCFNVSPKAFTPSPKCISTVFKIEIKPIYDRGVIFEIYKLATRLFIQRRKTILNNLSNIVGKKEAQSILLTCKIPGNLRPEQLSPSDYATIFFSMKNR